MGTQSPADSFLSLRSSPAGAAMNSAVLGRDIMDELERSRSAEEDALVSEVGHLSLNEEREVRFHGQASGLHLLDVKERVDGRNEGGIWWVLFTDTEINIRILLILSKAFSESTRLATSAAVRVQSPLA